MKNNLEIPSNQNCAAIVAAYMRYSSNNQDKCSIIYQRTAINFYAQQRGYFVACEYIDEACTGTNDRRQGFQQMMEDSKNNPKWSKVLVYDFSRFARNSLDADIYIADLEDLDFELISVTQEIDSDSAEGRLMRLVLNGLNEYYSVNLAKHVHAGLKLKATEGKHCGGIPPLGYNLANKKLVINEAEAIIVRRIFDMYENNFSYQQMADDLNSKGYRTKTGKPFTFNSFSSILHQEKYIGTYTWNKARKKDSKGRRNSHKTKPNEEQVILQNAIPPIITAEQFDHVQQIFKDRENGIATSKNRRFYLLSGNGFLKCKSCGSLMSGAIVESHGKSYKYYRCPRHVEDKTCCDNRGIKAEYIDRFVINLIAHDLLDRKDLIKVYNSSDDKEQIRYLSNQISGYEKSIRNILSALCESEYSDNRATLTARLHEVNKYKKEAEGRLAEIKASQNILAEADRKQLCKDIAKFLKDSESLEVKRYLKEVISEIIVSNEDVKITLNIS